MDVQPAAPTIPERLAERLTSEGQRTLEFFRALTPVEWEQVVYSEGASWRVRQVLAHFVSSEAANTQVVEDIILGGTGAPDEFDINQFNEQNIARMSTLSIGDMLAQYEMLRQATVNLVKKMDEGDLLKRGRHPLFGVTTVEDIIKLIYRHNQIHLRDIRQRLRS